MSALTRGRAILQENRTLILGNSFAIKPFPAQSLSRKSQHSVIAPSPISADHKTINPQRTLNTFSNKSIRSSITHTTSILPTISPLSSFERQFESQSPSKVLLTEDVDVSKIKFGSPLKMKVGSAKLIPIVYEAEPRTLKLQTPVVRIPFGLSRNDAVERDVAFAVQFSFDNMDTNPEIKNLYDLVNNIDDRVIEAVHKESNKLFDKEVPLSVLQHNYKRSIKQPPKGKTFAPLMKAKVPFVSDPNTKIHTPRITVFLDKKSVSADELKSNSRIVGILELKHIWIAGGTTFGITWQMLQAKIVEAPVTNKLQGYSFIENK